MPEHAGAAGPFAGRSPRPAEVPDAITGHVTSLARLGAQWTVGRMWTHPRDDAAERPFWRPHSVELCGEARGQGRGEVDEPPVIVLRRPRVQTHRAGRQVDVSTRER